MRFLMVHRLDETKPDAFAPPPEVFAAMGKLMGEMTKAGVLLAADGVLPSSKGALVSFHNDSFPDLQGLLVYVERLKGTAKLRPDSKLVITRAWGDADARLNGALQLSKGLARIVA